MKMNVSTGKLAYHWFILTFFIAFPLSVTAADEKAHNNDPAPPTANQAQTRPDRPQATDEDPKTYYDKLIKWLDEGVKFPTGKDLVTVPKAVKSAAPVEKKEEPRDLVITKDSKTKLVTWAKELKTQREELEKLAVDCKKDDKDDKAVKSFIKLLDGYVKTLATGISKDPSKAKLDEKTILAYTEELKKQDYANDTLKETLDKFAKWVWSDREGEIRTTLFDEAKARDGKDGKDIKEVVELGDKVKQQLEDEKKDALEDKVCLLAKTDTQKLGKDEGDKAKGDTKKDDGKKTATSTSTTTAKKLTGTPPLTGPQTTSGGGQADPNTAVGTTAGGAAGGASNAPTNTVLNPADTTGVTAVGGAQGGGGGFQPPTAFDPNTFLQGQQDRLNEEALAAQLAGQQNQFALEALKQSQASQDAALAQLANSANQGNAGTLEAIKALGSQNQNPLVIPPQEQPPFFPPSPAIAAPAPAPIPPPPQPPPMMGMGAPPPMPFPPMMPPPPPPAPPIVLGNNQPSYVPPPRQLVQPIMDTNSMANMELLGLVRQQQLAMQQMQGGIQAQGIANVNGTVAARIQTFSSNPIAVGRGGVIIGANGGFRPSIVAPGGRTSTAPAILTTRANAPSIGRSMSPVAGRSMAPARSTAAPVMGARAIRR